MTTFNLFNSEVELIDTYEAPSIGAATDHWFGMIADDITEVSDQLVYVIDLRAKVFAIAEAGTMPTRSDMN
jgi:hypothetical protein